MKIDYLKSLTQRGRYDLLCALRGSDYDGDIEMEVLKSIVTARLRAIVFDRDECQGTCCAEPMTQEDLAQVEAAMKVILAIKQGLSYHFLSHLHSAIAATRKHEIWGGLGDRLFQLL